MMSCDLHTWPIIFESNSLQLSCSCRPTSGVKEWSLRLKLWFTYLVQELVVEFMTVVKDVFVGWVQTGSDTVLHHHTGPGRTLELLNLRPSQTHTNVCQINLCWWYWTLNTSAVLYFCPAVFISKGVFSNWTEPLLLHWTHVEHLIILNFNFLKYLLVCFFCFVWLFFFSHLNDITCHHHITLLWKRPTNGDVYYLTQCLSTGPTWTSAQFLTDGQWTHHCSSCVRVQSRHREKAP